MEKKCQWGEEEVFLAYKNLRKVPGMKTTKDYVLMVLYIALLVWIVFKLLPLLNRLLLEPLTITNIMANLTDYLLLFFFILYTAWMVYLLFFRRSVLIRKFIRNNHDTIYAPSTIQVTENSYKETDAYGTEEVIFSPRTVITFIGPNVYGTEITDSGPRRLRWIFPRRLFENQEEENAFRALCAPRCRIEDVKE